MQFAFTSTEMISLIKGNANTKFPRYMSLPSTNYKHVPENIMNLFKNIRHFEINFVKEYILQMMEKGIKSPILYRYF